MSDSADSKHPIFILPFCISDLKLLQYIHFLAPILPPCIHFVCFITLIYTNWHLTYLLRVSVRLTSATKPSLALATESFLGRASIFCAAPVRYSLTCLLLLFSAMGFTLITQSSSINIGQVNIIDKLNTLSEDGKKRLKLSSYKIFFSIITLMNNSFEMLFLVYLTSRMNEVISNLASFHL